MYESLQRLFDTGALPKSWTSGVVTMIPKTKAMQTPESLRPIALQTTRQKWLTNILLIQHEDVLVHCVPACSDTEASSSMSMAHGLFVMACGKEQRCHWTSKTRPPQCHTRWWRRRLALCAFRSCTFGYYCICCSAVPILGRQRIRPGGLPLPARGYAPRGPAVPSAILLGSVLCGLPTTRPRSGAHHHDVCGRPHHLSRQTGKPTLVGGGVEAGFLFWALLGVEG